MPSYTYIATLATNATEPAFDPEKNIAYAASFLKSKYLQLNSWHKAIAHYHSATHNLGRKYKKDVIKIANNMERYKNALQACVGGDYIINNYYATGDNLASKKRTISKKSIQRKMQSNMMLYSS